MTFQLLLSREEVSPHCESGLDLWLILANRIWWEWLCKFEIEALHIFSLSWTPALPPCDQAQASLLEDDNNVSRSSYIIQPPTDYRWWVIQRQTQISQTTQPVPWTREKWVTGVLSHYIWGGLSHSITNWYIPKEYFKANRSNKIDGPIATWTDF